MCRLFDDTYPAYRFEVNDPEADAQARHVLDQGFETPTEHNLGALAGNFLFGCMLGSTPIIGSLLGMPLAGYGFEDVIAPQSGFDSESVLALPEFAAGKLRTATRPSAG